MQSLLYTGILITRGNRQAECYIHDERVLFTKFKKAKQKGALLPNITKSDG